MGRDSLALKTFTWVTAVWATLTKAQTSVPTDIGKLGSHALSNIRHLPQEQVLSGEA